jgi:hypothetical protein
MNTTFEHVPFARRLRPAPVGAGFAMPGYWVWCGSAIRGEDGRYHLFAARWPQAMKFLPGYQSYSEIVRAVADTPTGPYTFQEVVLGDRGSEFWDGRMTHNPVVLKGGDTYLLFYIGTTFEGAKPTAEQIATGPDMWPWYRSIRIGVATSKSVTGPWRRRDEPFLLPQPGSWDEHVVTNPSPCLTPDGRLLLYYRSYIKNIGCKLGLAIFDGLDGPCRWRSTQPLFDTPGLSLEDPCVFAIDGHLEMIAKDLNGNIAGELHAGIHLLSRDGQQWEFAPERKAYSRDVLWDDGQVRRMGCFERPQVLMENGRPAYLFAAMAEGPTGKPGGFANITRSWTGVVPLGRA